MSDFVLDQIGLRARQSRDDTGLWSIMTDENYLNVKPNLVSVDRLAGPGYPERLDLLSQLARTEIGVLQIRDDEVLRRIYRAGERGDLVGSATATILQSITCGDTELPAIARHAYEQLKNLGTVEDPDDRVFSSAGVHLVRRSPTLPFRRKLASLLIRVQHDSKLAQGSTEFIRQVVGSGRLVFSASDNLTPGLTLFDCYLGPLLGSISPFIWAFSAMREGGIVVYSLGRPIAGTYGEAAEPLQLLFRSGADRSVPAPPVAAFSSSEAIEWWCKQLNALFGVLTDPTLFVNERDEYEPARHLRAFLNVEQLFRRVFSIQTEHRDASSRRVLLFSVLDTLHGITGREITKNCQPSHARKILRKVRAEIPVGASELLLPGAERGIAALEGVADGFFLGKSNDGKTITLSRADGTYSESFSMDRAIAIYLDLLRNATHGFGTNRAGKWNRVEALLAQHDGSIGHDLPLISYLYLLELVTFPEMLKQNISALS